MAPSGVAGGLTQSSASSGIFFQGDAHPQQNLMNSNHFSSSFANSVNSLHGTRRSSLGPVSGDINQTVLHSVANSCPSVGASSFVTDANSAFPGGPQMQRSASVNNESYMRLPTSPMSFSSNNISASNSSIIDGPPAVHHSTHPHPDPNSQQHPNHLQHLQHHHLHSGVSSSTSLPTSQMGQIHMPMGSRMQNSFLQDPTSLSQVQKKPRLDIKQEDMVQQQVLQQLLQRQQDPTMQMQSHNPQLQAFIQQQQRIKQQQLLQSMPQLQRAQLQQQQQQQQQQQHQLRNQLQPQIMQQMALMKNPYDTGGICARRLMQYLFHQRRPADNNIAYWRKFVSEYYAPRAKKRWCLSLYDNVVHHTFGVFPQAAMDAWHCEICGTKSGRGFEATYEVLPRLNEIKFSSGVIDELLFLDLPRERRFASGIMMLEYKKAVQESIYEQARVVREGQLRIIFAQDLKILSWEFCAQRHEELLPRRLVTSQVNQLLQVAQKCQSTVAESGTENGPSSQDLQSSSNMMVTAGRQLAKSLELQLLNDLGFSKRYVRCLQIAEVVNSMKDLIDFCRDNKAGPIDGLKNYPQHSSAKLMMQKMQEMEQLATMQGLPTDRATLNKLMAMHSGMNNSPHGDPNPNPTSSRGALSGPAAAALALSAQQGMLLRNNSMTSSHNSLQQEPSSSFNNTNATPSSPSISIQGPTNNNMLSGPISNMPMSGGFSSPQHSGGAQQLNSRGPNSSNQLHPNQLGHPQAPKQPSPALQHQMIQQLLQQMNNGPSTDQSKPFVGMNKNAGGAVNEVGFGINTNGGGNRGVMAPTASQSSNMGGNAGCSGGPVLNKSNSFKTGSNSDSSAGGGTNSGFYGKGAPGGGGDISQNMLADEMVQEMTNGFTDSGFFNSDLDDNLGYGWKA